MLLPGFWRDSQGSIEVRSSSYLRLIHSVDSLPLPLSWFKKLYAYQIAAESFAKLGLLTHFKLVVGIALESDCCDWRITDA